MPRFYFNVHFTRGPMVRDSVGIDLPSLDAASAQAQEGIRETIAMTVRDGQTVPFAAVEICDERQVRLLRLPFVECDPRRRRSESGP